MMGPRQRCEPKLFYPDFNLDRRIPADHPLRKIAAAVDFDFVRPLVKPLYGRNGNRSIDPAVVLKLIFLLFYENVPSERALLERLSMRLDWLWFCGYDLDDALPDHSVLSKARHRWGKAVFAEFFQRVLGQCIDAGLVDRSVAHMDSSMIDGNASKDKLRVHLRAVGGQVYEQLEQSAPSADDERDGSNKTNEIKEVNATSETTEATQATVCPNEQAVASNPPDAADTFAANERDSSPSSESAKEPEETPRPGERITPVDPDARLGRKYGKTTLGYKDHRLVDDRAGIITATITTPANVNDDKMPMALLEEHKSNTQRKVDVLSGDAGYGTGEIYHYCKENDITPCIPHKEKNCNRDSDLGNGRFSYDQATDTFRCPAGKTLPRRQYNRDENTVIYEAPRDVCEKCIHFSRCVTSKTQGRRIRRNLNDPYIDWADNCLSRPERKRLMARRKAKIEGSFADAANNHGFKRARWRGLEQVGIQNLMIATAQNLRKLLRAVFGKRGKSTAGGILQSSSASFSSLGIGVRGVFRNFFVRTADPANLPVFVENATGTDNIFESIFDLAEN